MLFSTYSISNNCCSFDLSIQKRIKMTIYIKTFFKIDNKKCYLSRKSAYQNDFKDTEISFAITGINYILRHIKLENNY